MSNYATYITQFITGYFDDSRGAMRGLFHYIKVGAP